jgi:tetratricopeptide (TPR) repeat protein/tRNA A-37 threonylcarbamoyl transferase component Bud32
MSERRQEVRRVFLELAELPGAARAAALARACGGDPALRREVEALLRADGAAGAFLSSPTAAAAPPAAGEAPVEAGQMIGRYKLLQSIGEGGMGAVWLAEQREPVKRRVALKIIKLGMDTKQVIARFEAERQALALMDHLNIAKVLDAGSTESGRPYFVMEYINGVPILEYCDRERLATKERLELFVSVCHAIQHAHQKGVIHRDIKPSNVLVTLHDGVPVPKVIDFGIAKATSAELTSKTLFTEHRQLIGTPAYMSPEQAEMSGLDIDTRSDVYSLGVLLYELLTGTTPFDIRALLESGFAEMMRAIREDEPHKPSTRVSSLGDTAARTAEVRRVDTKKLGASLRGDLDWIVMKCLEKDRTRRYESASGLAADIKRHLGDEPVTAGPPGAAYQLRKFVKRHRGRVIAGVVVALVLVLGVVGTTAGLIRALAESERADGEASKAKLAAAAEAAAKVTAQENEQLARAEARRAEAAKEEEARARRRAETIRDFVIVALKAGDAHNAGGGQDVTILSAMDGAIADIESGRFGDDPEIEAALKSTIALILRNNGRLDEALALNEDALATHRRLHPGDHADVAASLNGVASVLSALGRRAETERLMRESLEMYRRLYEGDNRHVAALLNNLGELLDSVGRAAEAEPMLVQALEMHRRLLPGDHRDVAMSLDNLAKVRDSLGRYDEAEALYLEALEMRRRLHGGDHPDLAVGLNNLGVLRSSQGRMSEAEPLLVQALEMRRRLFEGDHPVVAEALGNLAMTRLALGRLAEAEPLIAEGLEMNRRLFPGDHPGVAHSLYTLSAVQLSLGHAAEAESVCLEAVEMHRRLFPGDHLGVAMSLVNLTRARQALHRPAEARASLDEAVAMLRRLSPGGSIHLVNTLLRSGLARLDDNHDAAAALPELEEALRTAEAVLAPDASELDECRAALARCRAALAEKYQ